jgi:hypothetical protein
MCRIHLINFVCIAALTATAIADTTIDEVNSYAYGANIGWMNMRGDVEHGALITHFCCRGYAYSANCGWICLGNGPENGHEYGNDTAGDWGVNHDGAGNLAGYAYGANIGWINFEQSYGRPRIDLDTGDMSGYVWGANVGWMSLGNAVAHVATSLATGPDSDGDSIPDEWEYSRIGDLATLSGGVNDHDKDGVPDKDEYTDDTDPDNPSEYLAISDYAMTSGGDNAVTWTRVRPSRFYRIECRALLDAGTGWQDSGLGLLAPASEESMTREVATDSASSRFLRIKAVVPLSP